MKLYDSKLKSLEGSIWNTCRKDWIFLTLLLLLSSFFVFKNLGNLYLILDEYDYAVLGKNILKFGFPTVWDGKNFIGPESHSICYLWGQQVWISFYLIAISYLCFGFTPLATRIPFAVSGLISVLLLYLLTLRITKSRKTARVASLLFTLSVSCLIYMRTGRYMALTFLMSILCIWFYLDLIEARKGSLWKFTTLLVAYFHVFYPQMIGFAIGIIVHLFICERRNKELRKSLIKSFSITFFLTFPWFALIGYPCRLKLTETLSGMIGTDYAINPGLLFMARNIFGFLAQINTYIFPFALIIVVGGIFFFLRKPFDPRMNRKYVLLLISVVLCTILFMTTSPIPMQNYISGTLPILFILLAVCFYYLYSYKHVLASVLLVVTILSNVVNISIWYPVEFILNSLKKNVSSVQGNPYFARVDTQVNQSKRVQCLMYNFLSEILTDFNGPQRAIVQYLLDNGSSNQTVLMAHEANAITFFTEMKLVKNIPFLKPPDWIIPRGEYKFKAHSFYSSKRFDCFSQDEYVRNIIKEKKLYRRIMLPIYDPGTENSYEIQCHRFSNYRKNDCMQVTLYQFIGEGSKM